MVATAAAAVTFSLSNPVFSSYGFYGTIVVCKMFAMALSTTGALIATRVFPSKVHVKGYTDKKEKKTNDNDDEFSRVERIRRVSIYWSSDSNVMLARSLLDLGPGSQRMDRFVELHNHRNDVENIPAFLLLGLLYVATGPSPVLALWHFRVFTVSRLLHTICYQFLIPQPSRAVCYTTGLLVCASMAFQVFVTAARHFVS